MTENTMEVDISDDDATLDEMPEDPGTEPKPEPEAEPEFDLEAAAKKEAKRLRDNSDGATQSEKVKNAMDHAGETLKENLQQYQQLSSSRKEAENRIERLEMTKERVENQPPDCEIVQTVAGGVSLEVPNDQYHTIENGVDDPEDVYTRSDLVDEIDETVEALHEKIEQLDDQEEKLERALQVTKQAHVHLTDVKELLGDEEPPYGNDPIDPAGAGPEGIR